MKLKRRHHDGANVHKPMAKIIVIVTFSRVRYHKNTRGSNMTCKHSSRPSTKYSLFQVWEATRSQMFYFLFASCDKFVKWGMINVFPLFVQNSQNESRVNRNEDFRRCMSNAMSKYCGKSDGNQVSLIHISPFVEKSSATSHQSKYRIFPIKFSPT